MSDKRGLHFSVLILVLTGAYAFAQQPPNAHMYPTKSVRYLVGFPPGGANDIVSRGVTQRLAAIWNQPVVVDNRPGAAGIVAAQMAAKMSPDGYTLWTGSSGVLTVAPVTYREIGFSPENDFAPIALVGTIPMLLTVNNAVPARTVADLVALAKAKPGQLNYASSGATGQLAGEYFKSHGKLNIMHIPYKGSAPAVTDLIGGQIQLMFDTVVSSLTHARAGKIRALGVTSAKRLASAPDLPTISESGLPGFEIQSWVGVMAPAGVPEPIIAKIHADVERILKTADMREFLQRQGMEAAGGMTPGVFNAFIQADLEKMRKIVREAGIPLN